MSKDLIHLTVAAVVENNGKFLIVEENCRGDIVLNQPAGHVENGESITDAAIRETLEETAWQVELKSLIALYRWTHPSSQETYFRAAFAAQAIEHFPDQALDDGILRALWLSHDELSQQNDRLRSPLVLKCIEDYLSGVSYPMELLVNISNP